MLSAVPHTGQISVLLSVLDIAGGAAYCRPHMGHVFMVIFPRFYGVILWCYPVYSSVHLLLQILFFSAPKARVVIGEAQ